MICLNVPAINLGWNSYNNVKQKESSGSLNSQTISTQAKTEERNPHNSDIPLNNKPNADNITLGQRIVNNFMLVLKTIRVIRNIPNFQLNDQAESAKASIVKMVDSLDLQSETVIDFIRQTFNLPITVLLNTQDLPDETYPSIQPSRKYNLLTDLKTILHPPYGGG